MNATVKQVAADMRACRAAGQRYALVVGAGCSAAGDPMSWAHLCMAQLLREGYADRVLTTGFEPLVARACALLSVPATIHDLAASPRPASSQAQAPAIFHLYGQRPGLVLSSAEERKAHTERLRLLFQDTWRGRGWLVVGCGGQSDALFQLLEGAATFDWPLHWIGREDKAPAQLSALLQDTRAGAPPRNTRYVGGQKDDGFLVELLQELGCFPPEIIEKPFTHLKTILEGLGPYPLAPPDLMAPVLGMVQSAIDRYENGAGGPDGPADGEGRYDQAIRQWQSTAAEQQQLEEATRRAFSGQAQQETEAARGEPPALAEARYERANGLFMQAYQLNPEDADVLRAWTESLAEWSVRATGDRAAEICALAQANLRRVLNLGDLPPEGKVQVCKAVGSKWALEANRAERPARERELLCDKAKDCFDEANLIIPGSGDYNLACWHALWGSLGTCRELLFPGGSLGALPAHPLAHVTRDPDLDPVRRLPWFRAFLDKLRSAPGPGAGVAGAAS